VVNALKRSSLQFDVITSIMRTLYIVRIRSGVTFRNMMSSSSLISDIDVICIETK